MEQLPKDQSEVADLARETVISVMAVGSSKDGCDDSWRHKPQDYHLDRALRHIITYKLVRDGNQPDNGEDHLALAITRLSMALTQEDT